MDFNVIDYLELLCASIRVIYSGSINIYNNYLETKLTKDIFNENVEFLIEIDKNKAKYQELISKTLIEKKAYENLISKILNNKNS